MSQIIRQTSAIHKEQDDEKKNERRRREDYDEKFYIQKQDIKGAIGGCTYTEEETHIEAVLLLWHDESIDEKM